MSCLHRIQQFPRNFLCWQAPGCIQIYSFKSVQLPSYKNVMKLEPRTKLAPAELTSFQRTVNLFIVFELTSFSFWNTLLTELSKPCTLSHTNMHKTQNKEVSRWMSHSKHRITYTCHPAIKALSPSSSSPQRSFTTSITTKSLSHKTE